MQDLTPFALAFALAQPNQPMYEQPYLVVFGRDTCGVTQDTVQALSTARVKFKYLNVDNKAVATVLHSRMKAAGLDTSRYLLPVVDLNNTIQIRPDNSELIARARSLPLQ